MRIVLASDHMPPHRSGHAVAAYWWARALAESGHHVTVVSDVPVDGIDGTRVVQVPTFPGLGPGHPLAALRPAGRALAQLATVHADVVHLHGYGPICRTVRRVLAEVPAVVTVHQFPRGAGAPPVPLLRTVMERMLRSSLSDAAVVTVPSQAARRTLRKRYGRDGLVVPVGVSPEFAHRPKRPGRVDPGLRIAYVGRRTFDKGFDTFVRLADAHPEATWIALGDGPLEPGGRVVVLSQRSPEQVLEALLGCDALLAPGLHETQGLAVLEALHAGTAVAIPRGSAQAELVREGIDGASYEPGDDDGAWRALRLAAERTRGGQVAPASGLEESRLVARMTAAFRSAVERA